MILDKIIGYELNPPTRSDFYQNALHVSALIGDLDSQNNPFIEQSETVAANNETSGVNVIRKYFRYYGDYNNEIKSAGEYFSNGVIIPSELKQNDYYESVNNGVSHVITQDEIRNSSITQAINNGVLYVDYFGHGSVNRWGSVNYTTGHLSSLKNGSLLPVVFGITCLSGRYHFTSAELDGLSYEKGVYNDCFRLLCWLIQMVDALVFLPLLMFLLLML